MRATNLAIDSPWKTSSHVTRNLTQNLRNFLPELPTPHLSDNGPRMGDAAKSSSSNLRPSGSRGLHIRCPHCQVALELLADAPLDEINCSGCGSNFSLVDWGENQAATSALQQIGRFQLLGRIGVGGFGTVWKARDTDLDRAVAIKIPRKGQLGASESELFFREARAAAQLKHPNIVPVHEVGRDGDTIFIVSELILGESLANWLKEQRPSLREMTELLAKVADALHYAHERGVVHRDFKPSNVMIDQQGEPHLMDFGLAKREMGEVTMTIDGQVLGTPAYMSPEQAAGGTHWVDRRTDVYSLGVVLFEVLTGELPFRGNAQMQIRERVSANAPNPRRIESAGTARSIDNLPQMPGARTESPLRQRPRSRRRAAKVSARRANRGPTDLGGRATRTLGPAQPGARRRGTVDGSARDRGSRGRDRHQFAAIACSLRASTRISASSRAANKNSTSGPTQFAH